MFESGAGSNYVDRRKADKMKKYGRKILFTLFVLAVLGLIGIMIYETRMFQITSSKRLQDLYGKQIETYVSNSDADGDGIDDRSDILESAIKYIETKPKYKSKYYISGYPNDGYGVCTDVVANALLGAGYDLMTLVAFDIATNPNDYDILEPDRNIDFRRVKNLKVFFRNHAISLTLDVNDIEEWLGGDIVIFKQHIGIVSDRRNKNGIPYVIHHNDPMQKSYEEDVLEKRSDIVGHYRISEQQTFVIDSVVEQNLAL